MPEDLNDNNSMLEGPAIEPLEREQRLYQRVVEKVLELISSGAWKPGFRLPPERELSESFGVSRTVVREAVKALEARGVLESTTGDSTPAEPRSIPVATPQRARCGRRASESSGRRGRQPTRDGASSSDSWTTPAGRRHRPPGTSRRAGG